MNSCAPCRVRGAVDDRGAVGDVGLQVLRQLDRLELRRRRRHVGDVDEPGVDGALGELADDPGDVGLERADVGEDRVRLVGFGSRSSTSRV